MIPLHLRISGFLSYRDPVELDFDSINLACISGHNGAGKSSLLDAFTWSLFGEARGRGADVINLNQDVKAAEVALTFRYEGNVYRVQRTLPRGKSTVLEFQVLDGGQKAEGGRQKAEGGGQGDEVAELAEGIRERWSPEMSKSAVSRLLGKEFAGSSWTAKVNRVIEYLSTTTPTTTENSPKMGDFEAVGA
jgi:predicted ATPase